MQFSVPGPTSPLPVSPEADYRLAEPIGPQAERVHVLGLQSGLPL